MKNLRVIMADNDITRTQLSNDLGISKTTVSSYVRRAVKRIDIEIMMQVANYFDVTLDELFGRVSYVAGNHVGETIKRIRLEKGMTAEEFGQTIDPVAPASQSLVSRWERGVNLPNKRRMKNIAEIANVTVEKLLNQKENEDE